MPMMMFSMILRIGSLNSLPCFAMGAFNLISRHFL
jgi:hypothetical protein